MSNSTRDRAKEHFPAVLLTLLSIVQAIALELLWGHVVGSDSLYSFSVLAILGWILVVTTLLVVILVWVVYASNVMRFRWVPAVTDSVYPFVVGVVEFWAVECLSTNAIGYWFIAMGLVFGTMTWVSQITMRRARHDADNAQFFENVSPASIADFVPQLVVFALFLAVGGLGAAVVLPPALLFLLSVLCLVFVVWQFVRTTRYWNIAMAPEA